MKPLTFICLVFFISFVVAEGYGVGDYGNEFYIGNTTIADVITEDSGSLSPSSSGCTYDVNYDWNCSAWSECINDIQIRECNERNNCGGLYGRPETEQICNESNNLYNGSLTDVENEIIIKEKLNKSVQISLLVVILAIILWFILLKKPIKKRQKRTRNK